MHALSTPLKTFIIVFIVVLHVCQCLTLFDWLFRDKTDTNSDGVRVVRSTGLKFEVQTADDKFLQLKDVIENLSELDSCNHIVSWLKALSYENMLETQTNGVLQS